ncbi:hypothetical protein B0T18DRAFT_391609 [Schizothecium vesticola]|uniref:Uncharacterized protein n=1 Tax=Schizothecium vesticola TaxID=314040 RepID=A0AA40ENQ7_9PEZI|nr:hypothetical protein B0T18DRAFT_391609 [Schizothecium vesticola]
MTVTADRMMQRSRTGGTASQDRPGVFPEKVGLANEKICWNVSANRYYTPISRRQKIKIAKKLWISILGRRKRDLSIEEKSEKGGAVRDLNFPVTLYDSEPSLSARTRGWPLLPHWALPMLQPVPKVGQTARQYAAGVFYKELEEGACKIVDGNMILLA